MPQCRRLRRPGRERQASHETFAAYGRAKVPFLQQHIHCRRIALPKIICLVGTKQSPELPEKCVAILTSAFWVDENHQRGNLGKIKKENARHQSVRFPSLPLLSDR
jgi:hypothetical protein